MDTNGVKYFACFLVLLGIYPNVPQITSWNSNNVGGSVKRGVAIAMQIGTVGLFLVDCLSFTDDVLGQHGWRSLRVHLPGPRCPSLPYWPWHSPRVVLFDCVAGFVHDVVFAERKQHKGFQT